MPSIVQITLRTADSVPANYLTNQFCIDHPEQAIQEPEATVTAFQSFYSGLTSQLLSSWVSQNGHMAKLYYAGGPKPNYPYYEQAFNLTSAPSGSGLPTEVAICLSFQGAKTPGFPQARRRGRIYIGTLKATVNSNQRPLLAARESLRDEALELYDNIAAANVGSVWCVWSPTDGEAVPLSDCWVDDAFDTQRSRGQEVTSRVIGDFQA